MFGKTETLRSVGEMEVATSFIGACRSVEGRGSKGDGSFVVVTLPVFSSDSVLTSGGIGFVSQDEGGSGVCAALVEDGFTNSSFSTGEFGKDFGGRGGESFVPSSLVSGASGFGGLVSLWSREGGRGGAEDIPVCFALLIRFFAW